MCCWHRIAKHAFIFACDLVLDVNPSDPGADVQIINFNTLIGTHELCTLNKPPATIDRLALNRLAQHEEAARRRGRQPGEKRAFTC